ncbi:MULTISPECIES: hypothetical protein [Nocardiaceae]|uniref:Copper(I)-binding protein n=1 Tax=Rhodococcoides corynebacterioides TaxID=53972 RepID=A0ABS2KWC8_9NOCA|nr:MULTISPECIES: hypothetical protein [Rhodococcus]MBM7415576.1 copper(I)-binding protein [Rhodococcus corynebacterioides]MBP1118038.1 copper(I)-binding protein [Rhodococcus sp. PvP016]
MLLPVTVPTPSSRTAARRAPLAAAFAVLAVAAVSCSSDTAAQQSPVGGTDGTAIEIRNVSIDAELTGPTPDDVSSAYGNATLTFTALNTSDTTTDTLVTISSPASDSVTVDATDEQRTLEPGTTIAAGQPVENLGDSGAGTDAPFTVSLDLADGELAPGTSITVTLTFEEAGDVTVDAPFDVTEPGQLDDARRPLPPAVTPAP